MKDEKLCAKCKWLDGSICEHPKASKKSTVFGGVVGEVALVARKKGGKCGPLGKLYTYSPFADTSLPDVTTWGIIFGGWRLVGRRATDVTQFGGVDVYIYRNRRTGEFGRRESSFLIIP